MVAPQLERAKTLFFGAGGLGVTNLNVSPGTDPGATAEQMAGELNRSMARVEAGEFEEVASNVE